MSSGNLRALKTTKTNSPSRSFVSSGQSQLLRRVAFYGGLKTNTTKKVPVQRNSSGLIRVQCDGFKSHADGCVYNLNEDLCQK